MKPVRAYVILLMLASVNSSVYATWEKVSDANAADPEMYMKWSLSSRLGLCLFTAKSRC